MTQEERQAVLRELDLAALFPVHTCGLYLEHNVHKDARMALVDWLIESDLQEAFRSEDLYRQAIATDECWSLQWYPETPIGFCRVLAPTLVDLLLGVRV